MTDTFRGFTVDEMSAAFDALQKYDIVTGEPSDHWKDRIEDFIDADDLDLVRAAVVFYTATDLRVVTTVQTNPATPVFLYVQADGYRLGPAN